MEKNLTKRGIQILVYGLMDGCVINYTAYFFAFFAYNTAFPKGEPPFDIGIINLLAILLLFGSPIVCFIGSLFLFFESPKGIQISRFGCYGIMAFAVSHALMGLSLAKYRPDFLSSFFVGLGLTTVNFFWGINILKRLDVLK